MELLALGVALRHLEPTPEGKERPEDSLPSEDPYTLAALRLALLTGMRKSEIIGDKVREIPALPWTAVDLDTARIRLDHHKTARKAGARIVPLSAASCELLESLPRVLGNPYVIPGGITAESLVNLQKSWERVRDAVGTLQEKAKVPKRSRVDVSDVTIHDLRRSFASVAARMGLIVGALLGHGASSVTAGYARIGADPLRDVVEAIGERMAALLAGTVDLEEEAREAKAAKEETQARKTKPSGPAPLNSKVRA
jgi:integrase